MREGRPMFMHVTLVDEDTGQRYTSTLGPMSWQIGWAAFTFSLGMLKQFWRKLPLSQKT